MFMTDEIDPENGNTLEQVRKPSIAVVNALADATGRDPGEIAPLYGYIDCEALDAVVTLSDSDVRVTFSYEEYTVIVESDGSVTVRDSTGAS